MRILFLSLILLVSCKSIGVDMDRKESKVFRKLKKLKYYKYADKNNLDYAKTYIAVEHTPIEFVPSSYFEDSSISISKRHYYMDGEWLWDKGGMVAFLKKDLAPYYEATGFIVEVEDVVEELNNKIANYTIKVNGKWYKILDNHKVLQAEVWGKVPLEIAKLLNEQLKKQGFQDRLYLISAGHDGRGIFLTEKQHAYIYNLVEDKWWKPYGLESWEEIFCKECYK